MIKYVLLAVVAVMSAEAAQMSSCKERILDACGHNSTVRAMIQRADNMTAGDQCNIIQRFRRENTANDYSPERVVFKDRETLISFVTSNEGSGEALKCSYRIVDLKGHFIETKVHAGRLYAVTSSIGSNEKQNGRVAVITRTNAVQWLVNTAGEHKGTPFFNVKDIAIDQSNNLIKLTYANGYVNSVDYQEALDGLNKYKQCVSGGCN